MHALDRDSRYGPGLGGFVRKGLAGSISEAVAALELSQLGLLGLQAKWLCHLSPIDSDTLSKLSLEVDFDELFSDLVIQVLVIFQELIHEVL